MKTFPRFSQNHFYFEMTNQILKVDIDALLSHTPYKQNPSPSE